LGAPQLSGDQGFDGAAPVAEISVNLKIDTQRVGLNLRENGFGAARVSGAFADRKGASVSKPTFKFIVPFPPGGATDPVAHGADNKYCCTQYSDL